MKHFKTWKTIKLGTGPKTFYEYYEILERANCSFVNSHMVEMPDLPVVTAPIGTEARLVNVSMLELGLHTYSVAYPTLSPYMAICERAKELGLGICSLEVALQLRLQYYDQPEARMEFLHIGMEPFTVAPEHCFSSDDNTFILSLCHDHQGLKIHPVQASRKFVHRLEFYSDSKFVFLQRA